MGITVHDTSANCYVKVCTAPNTWVVRNAWKKAYALWRRMRREALEASGVSSGGITATWADFKTYLSRDHQTDVDTPTPIDCADSAVGLGEWVYSTYHSPDGTASDDEFMVHLLGDNVGAAGTLTTVGIVEGYQNSRARVQPDDPSVSPTEFEDSWMMNLFDVGTGADEILEDMMEDGDAPPYDHDDFAGAAGNQAQPLVAGVCHVSQAGPIGYVGPFVAPLGLLQIETIGPDNNVIELVIEIAPGNYKGVAASDI